jgi:hypothetical protein
MLRCRRVTLTGEMQMAMRMRALCRTAQTENAKSGDWRGLEASLERFYMMALSKAGLASECSGDGPAGLAAHAHDAPGRN